MKTIQRFKEFTSVDANGCHNWIGGKSEKGYGQAKWFDKCYRAHRLAHELFKGPIPESMLVLHRCDNPSCVNPDHLFIGTQSDNMRDMVAKGRQRLVITAARNRPKNAYRTNTSGHVGVYAIRNGVRWGAKIGNKFIGCYLTKELAISARKQAVAEAM